MTAALVCFQNNVNRYEWILLNFSGHVDDGTRSRCLNSGDAPDSRGSLTFNFPKIIGQDQRIIVTQPTMLCNSVILLQF